MTAIDLLPASPVGCKWAYVCPAYRYVAPIKIFASNPSR
jgi:hypothetical protein